MTHLTNSGPVFKVTSSVHCLAGAVCGGGIPTKQQRFELEQARIELELILQGDTGADALAFEARCYEMAYDRLYRKEVA